MNVRARPRATLSRTKAVATAFFALSPLVFVSPAAALSPVPGSPFATGATPSAVAFSQAGQRLAVANQADDSVSLYAVDPTSGALGAVAGSPFAAGGAPSSVAFSGDGSRLAVADLADDTVRVFAVTSQGLVPLSGSPFATGAQPYSVAFSPDGTLLAVADQGDDDVSLFAVAGGAVSPVPGSPFATGRVPYSVAFSPGGTLLAVANQGDDDVAVFSASGTGLAAVPGSPFPTGDEPYSVAFRPDGRQLATADYAGNTVSVFSVTGASVTRAAGSPLAVGEGPVSVAFNADSSLLATANFGGVSTSVFSVVGAAPVPVTGSPFANASAPIAIAFGPPGQLGLLATAFGDGGVSLDAFPQTALPPVDLAGTQTGGAPGATRPPPVTVSRLAFTPARFVVGATPTALSARAPKKKTKPKTSRGGTTISYTLSGAGTVGIAISRKVAGLKLKGKGCVIRSPKTQKALLVASAKSLKKLSPAARRKKQAALLKAATCAALKGIGTLIRAGSAGPHTLPFSGRLGKYALAPGSYVAVASTGPASPPAATSTAAFTVLTAKKRTGSSA